MTSFPRSLSFLRVTATSLRVPSTRIPMLALMCVCLGPGAAAGGSTGSDLPPALDSPAVSTRVGAATSSLLAMQRGGVAASSVPRPVSGEIATRSYQRYLKSFDHPIPERFGPRGASGGTASGGTPP
jgi:hypothetical protein